MCWQGSPPLAWSSSFCRIYQKKRCHLLREGGIVRIRMCVSWAIFLRDSYTSLVHFRDGRLYFLGGPGVTEMLLRPQKKHGRVGVPVISQSFPSLIYSTSWFSIYIYMIISLLAWGDSCRIYTSFMGFCDIFRFQQKLSAPTKRWNKSNFRANNLVVLGHWGFRNLQLAAAPCHSNIVPQRMNRTM